MIDRLSFTKQFADSHVIDEISSCTREKGPRQSNMHMNGARVAFKRRVTFRRLATRFS
jgi:hypothetical protein